MTSAQTTRTGALILACAPLALTGCDSKPKITPPVALSAPYEANQVWAVAPFANESGVSVVSGERIADAFTSEVEQIDGIDTLPVNRVIMAMRRLNMPAVTTPGQARMLLNTLGADGLIVGTVTAYDPYQPPKFAAAIALFTSESMAISTIDPVHATRSRTDDVSPGAMPSNTPSSQASAMIDASNHQTQLWLNDYTTGRSAPDSAYGDRIYLYRMDLYTQFAAYRLLHDLLASERARLLPVQAAGAGAQDREMNEHAPSR